MAAKAVKECTSHVVALCPENKKAIKHKQADFNHVTNISFIINLIIEEWRELKK